jgi:galactonate dehydratase
MSLGIHYNTGGHDLLNFVTNPEVLTPVDGNLPIPREPGLGVSIDEVAVREADKDRHGWRNPIWRHPDGSFAEW